MSGGMVVRAIPCLALASVFCVWSDLPGAELPLGEGLTVTLAIDHEVYLPGTPVQLVVEAANGTDKPVGMEYAGPWPPPWPKKFMVVPPLDFSRVLDGLECTVPDGGGNMAVVASTPVEFDKTSASDLKQDAKPLVLLKPREKKFWRVPLPIDLIKPGKGEITCALPRLKATIGRQTTMIEVRQKLAITVIPEADTLKGIEADVRMTSGENSVPTLAWSIKQPKEDPITQPHCRASNCRIVIRGSDGRLIQERFWFPAGELEGEAPWQKPLSWDIALRPDYFAMAFEELFPAPGTYTVEASYRDFLPSGRRAISPSAMEYLKGIASPFYSSNQVAVKRDRPLPPPKYDVNLTDLEPPKGRWIAFSKSFRVEITPERWKLMTSSR